MPFQRVVHYRCKNCDYAFMRSEEFIFNGLCPFCGQANVEKIPDKGKDLIKEI
jgi:transposase-like protein